jgi:hypothetical protein
MNILLKMLAATLFGSTVGSLEGRVQNALRPVMVYAQRVGVGLSVIGAGLIAWVAGLFFMLFALFFYLSELTTYLAPAFWTGIVSLGIALILFFLGVNIIRQK